LTLTPSQIAFACLASLAAGFVDAIVGGGGLITTPALLIGMPQMPVSGVLATTKCASIVGTSAAAMSYAKRLRLPLKPLYLPILCAGLGGWLGAKWVSHLDPRLLRPGILVLLIIMALYTAFRPQLGQKPGGGLSKRWHAVILPVLAGVLGFYDGFFGPGTGSLLVVSLILLFGRDFLGASAQAKFLNGASNVGALLWFMPSGSVVWTLGLPMAACNLIGGLLGSRAAMLGGNRWIRWVFLGVVTALIIRLGIPRG